MIMVKAKDFQALNISTFISIEYILWRLFPIVWTILCVLMGISYGILESNELIDSKTKFIYYAQLLANALWSVIFFIFKWRFFAFVWIILLDALVICMVINFYSKKQDSRIATNSLSFMVSICNIFKFFNLFAK